MCVCVCVCVCLCVCSCCQIFALKKNTYVRVGTTRGESLSFSHTPVFGQESWNDCPSNVHSTRALVNDHGITREMTHNDVISSIEAHWQRLVSCQFLRSHIIYTHTTHIKYVQHLYYQHASMQWYTRSIRASNLVCADVLLHLLPQSLPEGTVSRSSPVMHCSVQLRMSRRTMSVQFSRSEKSMQYGD